MALYLQIMFFVLALGSAYLFWVRPILRTRPSCVEFYADADSCWAALGEKFKGLKTKLATVVGMIASAIIGLHDFLIPIATGIDWTPIRAMIPNWSWPIIFFVFFALIAKFRSMTDAEHKADLEVAAQQESTDA